MHHAPFSLAFATALTLSVPVFAQQVANAPSTADPQRDAPAVTEDSILRRWIERSPEVASLRAQVRGARFDVTTSTLWPNPQLQVSFLGTPVGVPPDGAINVGAQITQALPVFGQVSARRDAAVAALSQSEVSVANALWSRAADIQADMVARAFADARVVMIQHNIDEVAEIERIIERRVEAGANSAYDILRVRTAGATLRAALTDAELERGRSEARLLALIADPTLDAVPITREGLSAFRGPENLDALLTAALRRRPDLELARRGVSVALSTARRWEREAVPVPSVWLGGYGTRDQDSFSVTAGLSLPLPVFDRNQGLVGRARSDAEAQRSLTRAIEARVRFEVVGAWRARDGARTALEGFRREGITPTAELLQRAEVTYRAGASGSSTFTIQDLFDAYRAMWDARLQELALAQTFAEAEADLERAVALVGL